MSKVKNYLSLIKFSHTIFAMPFALIGFFMGVYTIMNSGDTSSIKGIDVIIEYSKTHRLIFIYIIACMVFARSAAMAFNRYLDREFDAKNPRTAIREIPSGIISPSSALRFTILNSMLFVGFAYMINITCFLLSPIALIIILGYSYTKRFTALCHVVLGLGLSLAPAGAFIAVTQSIDLSVILLSLAVIGWVSGFDIIYSLQDDAFDSSQGLWSIPSALGREKALRLSRILHIITAILIYIAGFQFDFGISYTIGAVLFTGLLVYQHSLVRPDDLSRVNIAFMTANGIASIAFAIFVIADLILFK
ncbi:MAG: 4-hydroxybenzoate octaprenyltransferase [Chitinophagaceae bacterium]|nr:MAG: 4-hydroxybenzoate octaprenyltransferase [Chitinophagaceae bacterium]